MIDLDNYDLITKYDNSDQLGIMMNWSSLAEEARNQALKFTIPTSIAWKQKNIEYKEPSNIIICGMGGSAIAGDYIAQLLKEKLTIPIMVNRDYKLPSYVSKTTLVFCISYSGNTEETLSRYFEALSKQAMIISISSGGLLEQFSDNVGTPLVKIRKGLPPRCSFPLIYISLISIFEKFQLLDNQENSISELILILKKLANDYSPRVKTSNNLAKSIAYSLFNTLPVFISHSIYAPVAFRAKCELNENSKTLALSENLPEYNHNGIVVFDHPSTTLNDVAFIFVRDKSEIKALKIRIEQTKKLASEKTEKILEIFPNGKSKLAKQVSLTYLLDFVSIYLAILYEVDPSITPSIDKLKEILKKELNLQDSLKNKILTQN